MPTENNLFSDFSPLSKADWEKRILKELKGRSLEDLQWQLGDAAAVDAFYQREDLPKTNQALGSGRGSNDWAIGEDFLVEEAKKTNEEVLEALLNGVNAPCFSWPHQAEELQLDVLFDQINAEFIATHFYLAKGQTDLLTDFYQLQKKEGRATATLQGSINGNFNDKPQRAKALLAFSIKHLPAFQVLTIEGAKAYSGPENAINCLAHLLSEASDNLFLASQEGFTAEQIAPRLQFSLTIGTSYFAELAKIRALQLLWPLLLKGYGIDQAPLPIIAVQLDPDSQIEDQDLNMIRTSSQAMAAILGGATRLSLLPANAFTAPPTPFTRRMARSIHHILKMESYLDRVIDPAAGSYYIEVLTHQFTEQAWKSFQTLEEKK